MSKKFVYFFGGGKAAGSARMKDLLGGKGSNLAEMTNLSIPVPAGFTITTEVCRYYYANKKRYPPGLREEIEKNLTKVEKAMGTKFGDAKNPLLVSVRSGARVSMPGMMDTVLNIGLNEKTLQGLISATQNERFAYDCYRRFIQMYGDVVLGLKPREEKEIDPFEGAIQELKKERGVKLDTDLTVEDLKELVRRFKTLVKERTGQDFPEEPRKQLFGSIGAVFESWNNKRAIEYRRLNNIPEEWGTAASVQAMVFGNIGEDSATGVAFTRDPATGEKKFYGEYLVNAQGEDVVAGIRTPQPINIAGKTDPSQISLEEKMSQVYRELEKIYKKLERHYRDMQDIEFTIQKGRLWMLQTRKGKRTAQAAVRMAVEMTKEGLISKQEAVLRVDPDQIDQLLHPTLDPKAKFEVLVKGLPASPGAAVGQIVFSAEEAVEEAKAGNKVILVRLETSAEDIHGMAVAQGILTARGGMTSHAAVVARGMGKCCVAGCSGIEIDYEKGEIRVKDKIIKRGEYLTLDGSTGRVIPGKVPTVAPSLSGDFALLMKWADQLRKLGVRTNADTPKDARVAREFGAEGIGLCRTEHMFFNPDRIDAMREMIVAKNEEGRRKALAKLLPMQREDFVGIFREMDGLPVIIRTLDPPLHEFLPQKEEEIKELAEKIGITFEELQAKVTSLHEANPMLGHRGCRLGVAYPEITEMQARAIFEAACQVAKEKIKVIPEVMIPLVGHMNELKMQRKIVDRVAFEVFEEQKVKIKYLVGTMIELPRAALTADRIAEVADFFSYGTNDLTQTVYGLSRDDAGKFLNLYVEKKIIPEDPFQKLDQEGVGLLVEVGIQKGRKTRPDLEVGICGEHGGEPSSVEFCHWVGMDYVSCSPYRVPIARLAAAHAALKEKMKIEVVGEA
ncbi:MAG: pyruvate, phosphate dikinase [Candidatus Edwardsbacteria bacterium]